MSETEYYKLQKINDVLLEAMREIAIGQGPYSMDPLQHAENTIEAMKTVAQEAIAKATK